MPEKVLLCYNRRSNQITVGILRTSETHIKITLEYGGWTQIFATRPVFNKFCALAKNDDIEFIHTGIDIDSWLNDKSREMAYYFAFVNNNLDTTHASYKLSAAFWMAERVVFAFVHKSPKDSDVHNFAVQTIKSAVAECRANQGKLLTLHEEFEHALQK